jgi:hypothetical protein
MSAFLAEVNTKVGGKINDVFVVSSTHQNGDDGEETDEELINELSNGKTKT